MKIGARALVEHVWRRGDIHFRFDAATDAEEGIATQRRMQQDRAAGYRREQRVSACWGPPRRESLEISGRIDGLEVRNDCALLEEFKTTREVPARLHGHAGLLHFAQLRLYAAMFAAAEEGTGIAHYRLRVIYCHPDTRATEVFEETCAPDTLAAFLEATCRRFALDLARRRRHRRKRNRALAALGFPHPDWRPAQRQMARAVFRSVRDGTSAIAEAPTGAGKTQGALYPALRALGDGHADRVVYLSARGTGQRSAEAALASAHGAFPRLRAITITAKQRACLKDRPVCDPDVCEFARGYYDRRRAALDALFATSCLFDQAQIQEVARRHRVCPFELSLDASVFGDVVVCDYNYVFDPVVRLRRVHGLDDDRTVLLIDEAHQLATRVRDALSVRLDRSLVTAALAAQPGADATRQLASIDRRLLAVRRAHAPAGGLDFETTLPALPARFDEAVARALDALAERSTSAFDVASSHETAVDALAFALGRWMRAAHWFDAERFAVLLRSSGREISLELRCLDPSEHIRATLAEFYAHARFSATLTPLPLFERLHGIASPEALVLPSPFPVEHLGVHVVPDVSVRYRHRASSIGRVVAIIETLVDARLGNYLVALPSFAFLDAVADAFEAHRPDCATLRQTPAQSAQARAAFLARFESAVPGVVGFVVLGGVFSEAIDLPGERLVGMIVVGIGLPPPSLEREREAALLGEWGHLAAYRYPAIAKVVQAAGRIIRTSTDRGVLILVDDRFLQREYRELLPAHWRIQTTRAARLPAALADFWRSG